MSFSPLYPCFTHRLFCGLLCYFVPLYIIRNPIQVHMPKALFLLPNCTFSFHRHVSLVSRLPHLVTPNSSEATFLMQMVIFIHMLFASPPSCQGPSLRTFFLNVFDASFLGFHHFVLGALARLLR
jgi:hypothetical protein